jgi:hypothetical protein
MALILLLFDAIVGSSGSASVADHVFRRHRYAMKDRILVAVFGAMALSGCTHLGPHTVARDRIDYNHAIADSWKRQTLLNIVKIRYADMPLFVDVASVVSGYSLEGAVNLGGTESSSAAIQGDFFTWGASGKYTDRPTVTYAPITGSQFNKNFMTPIPPRMVLFLMQSGWPVDLVFSITVDAFNGLRSQMAAGPNQRTGDTAFYRVIRLFRKVQQSGAAGMRIQKTDDSREATVLFFYRDTANPEVRAALEEATKLLGLKPGLREIKVTYGLIPRKDSEIAMLTRSLFQIMITLAAQVESHPNTWHRAAPWLPWLSRSKTVKHCASSSGSATAPRSPSTPSVRSSTRSTGSGSTIGISRRNGPSCF